MSQALFTVIDGALVNLAKVNCIEKSTLAAGQVLIHFENNQKLVLNGTVETVLLKIGGSKGDMGREVNAPRVGPEPNGTDRVGTKLGR